MRGKNPKKLSKFVPDEINRALHQGMGQVYDLYPVWGQLVGQELARHSRPLALSGQSLVVQVESPVWAAAIRQRHRTLLAQLREQEGMQQINEIRVRVSPTPVPVGPSGNSRRPASPVSTAATEAIALTAAATEDPALKEALMRLYSSTSKSNKDQG